jgi:hypothetical protein
MQQTKKWMRAGIIIFGVNCVYLNLVQTYQYKEYILHWIEMDKEAYWKVFGKTDSKYKGILWKRTYNLEDYTQSKEMIFATKHDSVMLINSQEIPYFERVSLVEIKFQSNFREASNLLVCLKLLSQEDSLYYYDHSLPLIQFLDPKVAVYDNWQNGSFFLEIPKLPSPLNTQIELLFKNKNDADTFSNLALKFYYKTQ